MKAKLTFAGLMFQAGLLLWPGSARAATCAVNPGNSGDSGQEQRVLLKIYRNFLVVAEGQIGWAPERLNFVLDTGTSPSVINLKVAIQFGLRTFPSSTVALGTQVSTQ